MAAGTSPSIATLTDGTYETAFHAQDGTLWTVGSENGSTNQGMYGGTSPSIAASPAGGWEAAFQANTGVLIEYGTTVNINTNQGMYGGTSPSIAPQPQDPPPYPGTTYSWYMDDPNTSNIEQEGCLDTGVAAQSGPGPYNTVLDFGRQEPTKDSKTGWGALDFQNSQNGGTLIPDVAKNGYNGLDVVSAYEDYANGWKYCNQSLPVWLGLGTNNCSSWVPQCPGTNYVSTTSGADWGSLVEYYLDPYYANTNIHPRGAIDAELAYNTPSATTSWIGGPNPAPRGGNGTSGFQGTGQVYFDYGDAAGCSSETCGAAGGPTGWTESLVYGMVYGYAGAVGMPEVYYLSNGYNWAAVATEGGGAYPYSSAMGTPSIDTAQSAWSYLGQATLQYPTSAATQIAYMP
jgi:hypothetical protein